MLLGPVTLVDCLVFVAFLVPQLFLEARLSTLVWVVIDILPFLLIQLPFEFIEQRYWRTKSARPAWVQGSSVFEDIVVRCVRYAFANIPPEVGVVFFSKKVSLPFVRWRLLRHGHFRWPVHWKEHQLDKEYDNAKGIWIMHQPGVPPDLVFYYIHGGGFVLGSAFFYFEFLAALHLLLVEAGFENPALFALDYTLAPKKQFPSQLNQAVGGYKHVLDVAKSADRVCAAGDSAGGSLILSMLLELGKRGSSASEGIPLPQMSVLVSPWVTLRTTLHSHSTVDYLDREALWRYATMYAGKEMVDSISASPGLCKERATWKTSSPRRGYFITYGADEVFAADIESFMSTLNDAGVTVKALKFQGDCGIHAWPVVSLFLSDTEERRLGGLRAIAKDIRTRSAREQMQNGKIAGQKSD